MTAASSASLLPSQQLEDLCSCLRLAQLTANQRRDMQRQAKRWFADVLETLEQVGVELFEHSTKTIPYTPSQDVLADVFTGMLPAPQRKNIGFKRVASDILNGLRSQDLALLSTITTTSHLHIDFDSEDGVTPVAILFHIYCTTDPDTPRTRFYLLLDHLGAKLNATAFESQRAQVDSRLKTLADIDQF